MAIRVWFRRELISICPMIFLIIGCAAKTTTTTSSASVTVNRAATCLFPDENIDSSLVNSTTVSRPLSSDIGEPKYLQTSSWESTSNYFWGFEDIQSVQAWSDLPSSVRQIVVAVIDTGVDSTHADLSGKVLSGYNWVSGNTNTMDDNGHGTHVAGTIAAAANSAGIVGVAPFVKILPLKVLNSDGSGYSDHVIDAIKYAVEHNADIINLSLGSYGSGSNFENFSSQYNEAISNAVNGYWGKKVPVFAASGNDSLYVVNSTPANAREAITVGAHKENGGKCSFSNSGWKLGVMAPGCGNSTTYGILSLKSSQCNGSSCPTTVSDTQDIGRLGGTSMATPHAVGMAALALAMNNDLTPAKLHQALIASVNVSTGAGNLTNKLDYEYSRGLASVQTLTDVANLSTLMGVRMVGPEEGVSPSSVSRICFRIESGTGSYSWKIYDVANADSLWQLNLSNLGTSQGTTIASGSGSSSQNIIENVALSNVDSDHAIVVEVTNSSSGAKYYDFMELKK